MVKHQPFAYTLLIVTQTGCAPIQIEFGRSSTQVACKCTVYSATQPNLLLMMAGFNSMTTVIVTYISLGCVFDGQMINL